MKKKLSKGVLALFFLITVFIFTIFLSSFIKIYQQTQTTTTNTYNYNNKASFLYPELSLQALSMKADNIFVGTVVSVGDTIMKPIYVNLNEVSLSHDEHDNILYYPTTPIYITTTNAIKGENLNSNLIYYEDGTEEDSQIYEGMEVILFLNTEGHGWGPQSIYLVIDNQVQLFDDTNTNNLDYSSKYLQTNNNTEYTTNTCDINDFINIIHSYLE